MVDFAKTFEELTGNPPFPWQSELYESWFSQGKFPQTCNLPTGLGKTSVIAVWLIALMNYPAKVPRRLVYVVNRRTVVDQTTTEVENLRKELIKNPAIPEDFKNLALSTLRGQFADNRQWSADPSLPAVIVGTVDMIGSRLLFSGYGIGFKLRPLHAGFLGQDALLVHDEAHLEPAFQELLIAIEKEQTAGRFPDVRPLTVMELSATSRTEGDVTRTFQLTKADEHHEVVKQRISAHKALTLHPVDDEKKQLAATLSDLALGFQDSGRAIVVFVRRLDDVQKVVEKLPQTHTVQLTGTLRGKERDELVDHAVFQRFLPERSRSKDGTPAAGTVYLVCTSAGEVGVNLSADDLICDLSTLDSMAQRFGRVNRFGLRNDTTVQVVYPTTFGKEGKTDPYEEAREKTLALLYRLNGDASPQALANPDIKSTEKQAAFAPKPTILPVTDILFDAWSMTSIQGELPGRPPVAEYLHGVEEEGPPDVTIAWREDVSMLQAAGLESDDLEDLLEVYPLKPHETLRDSIGRVRTELDAMAARLGDLANTIQVWVIDASGNVSAESLEAITAKSPRDRKTPLFNIGGNTLILPPQAGGLENGMFKGTAPYVETTRYDVADDAVNGKKIRIRENVPLAVPPRNKEDMRLARQWRLKSLEEDSESDDDAAAIERRFYVANKSSNDEMSQRAKVTQSLQGHVKDVEIRAERFLNRLGLTEDIAWGVRFGAMQHDTGKHRRLWQQSIGNENYPDEVWGKSDKAGRQGVRSSYRHEFGSLYQSQTFDEWNEYPAEVRELALHLIATHHGRGRPHFPAEEVFDPTGRDALCQQIAAEVPRRFARLQRKYGRWGLAYIESLLRAADYAASVDPKEGILND